jgi:glutaredoxin 3
MRDAVIYTKSWCGYCTRAKELLARKGVSFTEIEISNNDVLRDEMIGRASGRTTVPQIFIGETHVGGYDDLKALDTSGKLDGLLSGS